MAKPCILVGDVGGTKTELALFPAGETPGKPQRKISYPSQDYGSLEAILEEYLAGQDSPVERACFDVAGPVVEGRSHITNLLWKLDARQLEAKLAAPVVLINDMDALAQAVAHIGPADLEVLLPGSPVVGGARRRHRPRHRTGRRLPGLGGRPLPGLRFRRRSHRFRPARPAPDRPAALPPRPLRPRQLRARLRRDRHPEPVRLPEGHRPLSRAGLAGQSPEPGSRPHPADRPGRAGRAGADLRSDPRPVHRDPRLGSRQPGPQSPRRRRGLPGGRHPAPDPALAAQPALPPVLHRQRPLHRDPRARPGQRRDEPRRSPARRRLAGRSQRLANNQQPTTNNRLPILLTPRAKPCIIYTSC